MLFYSCCSTQLHCSKIIRQKKNYSVNHTTSDTIIWVKGIKLDFSDFQGQPHPLKHNDAFFDTAAIAAYAISYHLNLNGEKRSIHAYAIFEKKRSWILIKTPRILMHEQGHFDIAAIYAKKLEKIANDSSASSLTEYIHFVTASYYLVCQELTQEEDKYDQWSKNNLGEQHYYKWIKDQTDSLYDRK